MKKIREFVKKYGTSGASLILRQAAMRLRSPNMTEKDKTDECADLLKKIAENLTPALEELIPNTDFAPHEAMFTPDWSQSWTGEVSEDQLKDFKFEGPGWYVYPNTKDGTVDTILALPTETPDLFRFHVWNDRDARRTFDLLINLPTHREP